MNSDWLFDLFHWLINTKCSRTLWSPCRYVPSQVQVLKHHWTARSSSARLYTAERCSVSVKKKEKNVADAYCALHGTPPASSRFTKPGKTRPVLQGTKGCFQFSRDFTKPGKTRPVLQGTKGCFQFSKDFSWWRQRSLWPSCDCCCQRKCGQDEVSDLRRPMNCTKWNKRQSDSFNFFICPWQARPSLPLHSPYKEADALVQQYCGAVLWAETGASAGGETMAQILSHRTQTYIWLH